MIHEAEKLHILVSPNDEDSCLCNSDKQRDRYNIKHIQVTKENINKLHV
jgi:hypothetical protein